MTGIKSRSRLCQKEMNRKRLASMSLQLLHPTNGSSASESSPFLGEGILQRERETESETLSGIQSCQSRLPFSSLSLSISLHSHLPNFVVVARSE